MWGTWARQNRPAIRLACQLGPVQSSALLPCSAWPLPAAAACLLKREPTASAPAPPCTPAATLINAPSGEQLLISANHCLGFASAADTEILWGVMLDYDAQCVNGTSGGVARPPQYILLQVGGAAGLPALCVPCRAATPLGPRLATALQRRRCSCAAAPECCGWSRSQGLEVLWNNEATDVMLLRLEDEIPLGGLNRARPTYSRLHRPPPTPPRLRSVYLPAWRQPGPAAAPPSFPADKPRSLP